MRVQNGIINLRKINGLHPFIKHMQHRRDDPRVLV